MHIKKSEATMFEHSKDCTVWEYEFPSKDLSYATAIINGRYPTEKRVRNRKCQEVYFVLSGSGTIHSAKGDVAMHEGDLYFFEKNEIYWVEGNNLKLALVNTPKWTPDQHEIVE